METIDYRGLFAAPDIPTLIRNAARRRGVDPDVAVTIARAETNGFDQRAVSPKKAFGVMQLMPGTAAEMQRKTGMDPATTEGNIENGVQYLRDLKDMFPRDKRLQIAAYNAGPGAVQKYGGVPPYKETQGYVRKILGWLGPREAHAQTPPRGKGAQTMEAIDYRGLFETPDLPPQPSVGMDVGYHGLFATPTQLLEQRPIVGTQRVMGIDVPIRQPGTLAEQRTAQPGAQAQPPTEALKGAAAIGINAAGGAGGAALGALTSPVTGPVGPIVGEMAGSYGARKLNVALGLEEEGTLGDVASVAVPGVVRAGGLAYRALKNPTLRHLPGAGAALHQDAAERLQAQAPAPNGTALPAVQQSLEGLAPTNYPRPTAQTALDVLRPTTGASTAAQTTLDALAPPPGRAGQQVNDLLTRMQPATPSADLYAPLHGDTTVIRPSNIWRAARDVLHAEQGFKPSFRNSDVARVAEEIQEVVRDGGGAVPLNTLIKYQQRLGLMVRKASADNWPQERALKKLYAAFYGDVDHAAAEGVPSAAQYRDANAAFRRESALEDVREMLAPGSAGVTTGPRGEVNLPPGVQLERTLERKAAQDPLFRDSFTSGEWTTMRAQVKAVQAEDAMQGFAQHLQPGRPGMVTDPATGAVTIGDIKPIRTAFEQELKDNPTFRAQMKPAQVKMLREQFTKTEHEQAMKSFAKRLHPGQPGMVTDPETGAVTIGDIKPIRQAFERELAENPSFRAQVSPAQAKTLREQFQTMEQDQAMEGFLTRLRPGQPGVTTDAATGMPTLNSARPIRIAWEKELTENPAFRASFTTDGIHTLRSQFHAAEKEQAEQVLHTMFTPNAPGILTRPDGLVQLHGGQLASNFDKKLATDPTFREAISPHQEVEIRKLFTEIQDLPRIPAPRGVAIGSGLVVARAGLGYSAAKLIGLGGEAAQIIGGATAAAPYYLGQYLLTKSGRTRLLSMLKSTGGAVSPEMLGLASGGARQAVEQGTSVEHPPVP